MLNPLFHADLIAGSNYECSRVWCFFLFVAKRRLSPIKKRTRVVVFKFSHFIESFSSVRGNREIYTLIYVLLSDSVCRDCELVAAGAVLNSNEMPLWTSGSKDVCMFVFFVFF